ncbi:4Fe-4S dicluster domain-containing protein [Raoultibacter phocaeensis]|uniref:4Fe-4S dicluster domain-containing protein n=1 Tax=Raoultibacter phocaeensis TaxID=2479841 RepID=UPI0011185FAC|nr:4Fe-4S dicluster domain-containing protein [Raoultibacter phocaeensis]
MSEKRISRRGFLAAGCVSAAMVGLGGIGLATRQADAAYVRPPGMESQADLIARCDRCQRCLQVCPYDIITPLPLGENLVAYGTPVLDFTHGYCDFCMLCTDVCPTGALRLGTPTEANIGVAKVIKDACVAWDWTGCTVCKDECPVEGAITLDDHERPVVHADLCDGCGRCEEVCPSASLRAYNNAVEEKGIVVVSRDSVVGRIEGPIEGATLRDGRYVREGDVR